MRIPIVSFVALLLLSIIGCAEYNCSSKATFLKSYDTFIASVKAKSSQFTKEDWVKQDAKFEMYAKECYTTFKEELTPEEKEQYWALTIAYYGEKHKENFLSALRKGTDEIDQFINSELNGSIDIVESEIKKLGESLKNGDLRRIIDTVKEEVKSIGAEVKEAIEEQDKQ
jgi:hypothetical protein